MKRWLLAMVVACNEPPRREPVATATRGPAVPADAAAVDARLDARADSTLAIVDEPGLPRRGSAAEGRRGVIDAPIAWSPEREQLTLEYRRRHSDPDATDLTIAPHVIVLHYTSGSSAKATRGYFDQPRIEKERAQLRRGGAVNVSAHFLVDRDGTIYRLQPETRYARHCIGLNHLAIGIENVGDEDAHPLTDAQVEADAALVRDLAARFPITHLFGHFEVMKLRASPLFVEREPDYRNDKPDPGPRFLARVRERVADLHLSGL